jgi:hypothetical protein
LCDRLGLVDQVFSSTWESLHLLAGQGVNQFSQVDMLCCSSPTPPHIQTTPEKNRTSSQKQDTQITSGSTLYISSYAIQQFSIMFRT